MWDLQAQIKSIWYHLAHSSVTRYNRVQASVTVHALSQTPVASCILALVAQGIKV